MVYLSENLLKALEFASVAHKSQMRKYPVDVPYISHCFAVALILNSAGYREDVVIAGVLHDIIEDTEVTVEGLRDVFGEKITELVLGVTEDKTLPTWEERKKSYLEHLKTADAEVMAISAADLLANRTDILIQLRTSPEVWKKFESPEQVMSFTKQRLNILKTKLNGQIIQDLEDVVFKIEELMKYG